MWFIFYFSLLVYNQLCIANNIFTDMRKQNKAKKKREKKHDNACVFVFLSCILFQNMKYVLTENGFMLVVFKDMW